MDIKGVVKRGEYTYRFTVSCGFDGSGKHTRKTMTYKVPAGTAQGKAEKMVMQAYLDFEAKCKGTPRYSSNMRFKELATGILFRRSESIFNRSWFGNH